MSLAIFACVCFPQYMCIDVCAVCMCVHVSVLSIIATLLSAIASHSYCGTTNSLYQGTDNRL